MRMTKGPRLPHLDKSTLHHHLSEITASIWQRQAGVTGWVQQDSPFQWEKAARITHWICWSIPGLDYPEQPAHWPTSTPHQPGLHTPSAPLPSGRTSECFLVPAVRKTWKKSNQRSVAWGKFTQQCQQGCWEKGLEMSGTFCAQKFLSLLYHRNN